MPGRRESGGRGCGGGTGSCSLQGQNVSGLLLEAVEETADSNDCIGCNFKLLRGHTFMTTTK